MAFEWWSRPVLRNEHSDSEGGPAEPAAPPEAPAAPAGEEYAADDGFELSDWLPAPPEGSEEDDAGAEPADEQAGADQPGQAAAEVPGGPEGEQGAEVSTPPQPEPVAWDPLLVQKARQYGFSDAEILSTGGNQALQGALSYAERLITNAGRLLQQQQQPAPDAPAGSPPAPQAFRLDVEALKAAGYEDDLIQQISGLHDYWASQQAQQQQAFLQYQQQVAQYVQPLQEQVQSLLGAQQHIQQQQAFREFDEFVGSLGEEWHDTLGQGPTHKLDPNSAAYQARARLSQVANGLDATYRQAGQPLPLREVLRRAAAAEFGDRTATAARRQITDRIRDGRGRFTARANGVDAGPPTPEQSLEKAVEVFEEGLRGLAH